MKILVINTAASEGGALSILQDFYRNIKLKDEKNQWFFLLSAPYLEETDNIKTIIVPELKSWSKRILFDLYSHKKILKQIQPDLVFSMQNTALFTNKIPQALYLHQPLPFQKEKKYSFFIQEERKFAIYQYIIGTIIKFSLRYTDKIIVQTKWMKKAIENLQYGKNKTVAIQPPIVIDEHNVKVILSQNRFFYPTSDIPYKNISIMDEACKIISEQHPELEFNIEITIDRVLQSKHIHSIGKISRSEVIEKYKNSILVFPSYIETFGMPLAEARKIGTIILASDTEFSRELLKGYENAYYFNYEDSNEIAKLIHKCITKELTLLDSNQPKLKEDNNGWDDVREEICAIVSR